MQKQELAATAVLRGLIIFAVKLYSYYVSGSVALLSDGLVFHGVMGGFMVQGGGFKPDGTWKSPTRDPLESEASNGLKNLRGTLAMARSSDPDSATSQFYINTVDNSNLDYPKPDGYGDTV